MARNIFSGASPVEVRHRVRENILVPGPVKPDPGPSPSQAPEPPAVQMLNLKTFRELAADSKLDESLVRPALERGEIPGAERKTIGNSYSFSTPRPAAEAWILAQGGSLQ